MSDRVVDVDNPAGDRYQYGSLDQATEQIRLLSFDLTKPPPGRHENLHGDLIQIPLRSTECPAYYALSYLWNVPGPAGTLQINGQEISITHNLHRALVRVLSWLYAEARREEHTYIWADAVCINQRDDKEKSWQVGMMKDIFSHSRETLAYIGHDIEGAERAIVTLNTLADIGTLGLYGVTSFIHSQEKLLTSDVEDLESVKHLFQQRYFKRIWVFQEVVLSRRLRFLSNTGSINGNIVSKAVTTLQHAGIISIEHMNSRDPSLAWARLLDALSVPLGIREIMGNREVYRENHKRTILQLLSSKMVSDLEATQPIDHIYALLGLSSDAGELELQPDYTLSWGQAFARLTEALIKRHGMVALQTILILSLHTRVPDWPSWMPFWGRPALNLSSFSFDNSGHSWHLFSAARSTIQTPVIYGGPSRKPYLRFEAFHCGTVVTITPSEVSDALLSKAPRTAWYRAWANTLHKFFAEHYPEDDPAHLAYRFLRADVDWEFDSRTFRRIQEVVDDGTCSVMTMSEHANRCVFTSSDGRIGRAFDTIENGDQVWIIKGIEFPVILRQESEKSFSFVSDAYVQGIMDGEFLATNPECQYIELV
ncbi:heterokaryon incompatibility protein-domain-containing protein [Lophiotrema nucula]|uniref:Heterokaryon incompatibility protein-domain-containing protein n=1 Tax=Lophiotrema nucula TaxID=690887 RepID=A0A6A5ZTU7_9PLEO|nr:heterokaryon incompatibility protein-domain-containing protein [Lophiotrema nucula]